MPPKKPPPPDPPMYSEQQVSTMVTAIAQQMADRIIASHRQQPHPLASIASVHVQLRDPSNTSNADTNDPDNTTNDAEASTPQGFAVTFGIDDQRLTDDQDRTNRQQHADHQQHIDDQQRFPDLNGDEDAVVSDFVNWFRTVPGEDRDALLERMQEARQQLVYEEEEERARRDKEEAKAAIEKAKKKALERQKKEKKQQKEADEKAAAEVESEEERKLREIVDKGKKKREDAEKQTRLARQKKRDEDERKRKAAQDLKEKMADKKRKAGLAGEQRSKEDEEEAKSGKVGSKKGQKPKKAKTDTSTDENEAGGESTDHNSGAAAATTNSIQAATPSRSDRPNKPSKSTTSNNAATRSAGAAVAGPIRIPAQKSTGSKKHTARDLDRSPRAESSRAAQNRADRAALQPSLQDPTHEEYDPVEAIARRLQDEEYNVEIPEEGSTYMDVLRAEDGVLQESEEVRAQRQKEEDRKARNKNPVVNEPTDVDLVPQLQPDELSIGPEQSAETKKPSKKPNSRGAKQSKQSTKSQTPPSDDDDNIVVSHPSTQSSGSRKKPNKKQHLATDDDELENQEKPTHHSDESNDDPDYDPEADPEANESDAHQEDTMPPPTSRPPPSAAGSDRGTPGPAGQGGKRGNRHGSASSVEPLKSTPRRSLRGSAVDRAAAAAAARNVYTEDPDPKRKQYRGYMNTEQYPETKTIFPSDPDKIFRDRKRLSATPVVKTEPTSDLSDNDAAATPTPANANTRKGSKATKKRESEDELDSERDTKKVKRTKKPAPESDEDVPAEEPDKPISISSGEPLSSDLDSDAPLDDLSNQDSFDGGGTSDEPIIPDEAFNESLIPDSPAAEEDESPLVGDDSDAPVTPRPVSRQERRAVGSVSGEALEHSAPALASELTRFRNIRLVDNQSHPFDQDTESESDVSSKTSPKKGVRKDGRKKKQ